MYPLGFSVQQSPFYPYVYPHTIPVPAPPTTSTGVPTTQPGQPVDPAEANPEAARDTQSQQDHSASKKSSPKILGQKFEDGVLKIIYDPDDLKRYRQENQIPEPENSIKLTETDQLPLLPISSGGHDIESKATLDRVHTGRKSFDCRQEGGIPFHTGQSGTTESAVATTASALWRHLSASLKSRLPRATSSPPSIP